MLVKTTNTYSFFSYKTVELLHNEMAADRLTYVAGRILLGAATYFANGTDVLFAKANFVASYRERVAPHLDY